MIYTSSHLANKRIRKQNDELAQINSSYDDIIESFKSLNKTIDYFNYKDKNYKKRIFTHRKTGHTYELNHFKDFEAQRKEIINDVYNNFYRPRIFIITMATFVIGFSIFMCVKSQ